VNNVEEKFSDCRERLLMQPIELWEFLQIARNAVIIDMRPQSAFQNGHMPGAVCFESISNESLQDTTHLGDTLVIYSEEGDYEDFSCKALSVICLEGGWLAWMRDGLPIEPPLAELFEPGQLMDGMDKRLVYKPEINQKHRRGW
jgi:rhodanese-related sulfurtransferase